MPRGLYLPFYSSNTHHSPLALLSALQLSLLYLFLPLICPSLSEIHALYTEEFLLSISCLSGTRCMYPMQYTQLQVELTHERKDMKSGRETEEKEKFHHLTEYFQVNVLCTSSVLILISTSQQIHLQWKHSKQNSGQGQLIIIIFFFIKRLVLIFRQQGG